MVCIVWILPNFFKQQSRKVSDGLLLAWTTSLHFCRFVQAVTITVGYLSVNINFRKVDLAKQIFLSSVKVHSWVRTWKVNRSDLKFWPQVFYDDEIFAHRPSSSFRPQLGHPT